MRIEVDEFVRSVYNRFKQDGDDYSPFTEQQVAEQSYEYSTLGPGNNEGIKKYAFNGGAHKIRYVHYLSPDILLVHQSKMVGFYLKMGSGDILKPVDRMVKDRLLRDSSMR